MAPGKSKILIVDDEPALRKALRTSLSASGFDVSEARNGEEALATLPRTLVDIVLLDINIPGRNGLEVMGEIKRLRPRTPVLVLSAYPEEEFAVRALKLGASGYVNKSLASGEIVAAAKKALAGGKYVTASLAEKLAASLGGDVGQTPHESLSSRELQVLRMIASGRTLKEIAGELALSEKTVGTYRLRIAKKMGLNSNVELTRYAMKHRLVD